MKKMNKMYEAPVAEVIKVQMPVVVMSIPGSTSDVTINPDEGD